MSLSSIDSASPAAATFDATPMLKKEIPSLWKRVMNVAIPILKFTAVTAAYIINPSLFVVGAVIGVICHQTMREVAHKIQTIWQEQDWAGRMFIGTLVLFSLPIFTAAATFLAGAHCGAVVTAEALKRARERHAI
ncbi:MAG: hypothetical protein KDK78_03820 [Chlamydiia bacterium]|nr:hypothetical protein [Chlamydiia bacterium]